MNINLVAVLLTLILGTSGRTVAMEAPLEPSIKFLQEKKLVGMTTTMSLRKNQTASLWRAFMGNRQKIQNGVGTLLYSIQIFEPDYFVEINPDNEFVKWAALEVTDYNSTPEGFQTLTIPAGWYAVFAYHAKTAEASEFFRYIFQDWLLKSEYDLDTRPHFEILGDKYRRHHPNSEEEVWIPIRR